MNIVIEESVLIHASINKVWEIFSNLTCWKNWNTVMKNVCSNETRLCQRSKISCSFQPFFIPIKAIIHVEEVIPHNRVVWSAKKKGFFARNKFIFHSHENRVLVTSRETYGGPLVRSLGFLFPKSKMRTLIKTFLKDLKKASES
jgi:hypothetical protein